MHRNPKAIKAVNAKPAKGFTLIELIVVIVILGILSAVALPRMVNFGSSARIASIRALAGTVTGAVSLVRGIIAIRGAGTASGIANVTFVNLIGTTQVRVWNGYPDRWCDGIGIALEGMTVPGGGCYRSTAGVPFDGYTFYGYGNNQIPGRDAGWRIESAPNPTQCSVQYTYNGTGVPIVRTNIDGC